MKNFTRKFIGLLIIAFTLFISQSYAQLSLHVNTTTNSVYFSNSFPVSVSVYDFNLVSSTPWSVTTSSGIDFGSYGCNNETFGDGSSAYMCGIHSGYWEPYASGLISLDGQPLYSGSGSAGGIGNNVISIDYTSSDQANGIPVEGNVYNISGGGQSTSVPSGNRHIAYMAPQTIEYIYAEAHTGGGNMTSIPVYINGQLLEQDCAGTWGGSSVNDACGVCDGDNSSCSGCTSSWASNYDQDATIDDESCVLSGCTDQTAINYNQNATDDDGSCIALILGCMDAEAVNYDANANTDNGMCQPYTLADVESAEDAAYADGLVAGFADGHADGVIYGSPILIDAIIDLPEGWSMFGYTCIESMNVIDGFSEIASNIVIVKDYLGNAYLTDWNFNAIGDLQYGEGYQIKMTEEVDSFYFCQTHTLKIYGCIDETALNYNSGANTDDGSCIAAVIGCMDESALNYNPEANTGDDSCNDVVLGCTNEEDTENYDESANTDDGSCEPIFDGDGCAQLVANDPWTPLEFFSMMGMGTECEQVLSACSDGNDEACDFICEISDQYYEFGSCGCSANLNCPDFAVVDYASGGGTYTYSQSEIHFIHGSGAQVTYNIFAPNAESVTLVVESGSDMIFNIYYEGSEPVVNLITQSGTGSFNLIQQ
jgi:hypothetical protein